MQKRVVFNDASSTPEQGNTLHYKCKGKQNKVIQLFVDCRRCCSSTVGNGCMIDIVIYKLNMTSGGDNNMRVIYHY